jgi:hypothetical protein
VRNKTLLVEHWNDYASFSLNSSDEDGEYLLIFTKEALGDKHSTVISISGDDLDALKKLLGDR